MPTSRKLSKKKYANKRSVKKSMQNQSNKKRISRKKSKKSILSKQKSSKKIGGFIFNVGDIVFTQRIKMTSIPGSSVPDNIINKYLSDPGVVIEKLPSAAKNVSSTYDVIKFSDIDSSELTSYYKNYEGTLALAPGMEPKFKDFIKNKITFSDQINNIPESYLLPEKQRINGSRSMDQNVVLNTSAQMTNVNKLKAQLKSN